MKATTWPGTRDGLLESIATAQALAWVTDTESEYLHWDARRAELEGKAGRLTEAEVETVVRTVFEKRAIYEGEVAR